MKKILILFMVCLLFTGIIDVKSISAFSSNHVIEKKVNNENTKNIYYLDNDNQVIENSDGSIVIKDYSNELTEEFNKLSLSNHRQKRSIIGALIFVATVALKVVNYASTACYVINVVNGGHDVCVEAVKKIFNSGKRIPNGERKYDVYKRYITGRKPGCEPMHSAQCNGYWEYVVNEQ